MNQQPPRQTVDTSDELSPGQRFLYRAIVWVAVLSVLYLLRSFFLLIFLTFVFSYILSSAVDRLASRIRNRTLRTVLAFAAFLGLIIGVCNFLAPRVKSQAEGFAHKYPEYMRTLDTSLVQGSKDYPVIERVFPQIGDLRDGIDQPDGWQLERSVSARIIRDMLNLEAAEHSPGQPGQVVEALKGIFSRIIASVSAFLLALLLSFLIVLDLPRLTESARGLRETKLRTAYEEIAPSVISFGRVLGRAFEAQVLIALLNTVLTAIGVYLLGLGENVAFFSLIVFLGSFIPVVGVFISSAPICLLALQEYGVSRMLIAILMITVIHMIEAYVLNPKIYGHHLRTNPVIVLIILTVAGKLFHIWGLVLGVPVCAYIFSHAIRREEEGTAAVTVGID